MALDGTYSGLLASIASWADRTDLTDVIPDFVVAAESRLARDLRIRKQISTTTLTTVGGTAYVALPADFLEIENITITSASPQATLSVVTPEIMDRKFPAGFWTGQPQVYSLLGDNIYFGPTPDAAYTISLDYYARLAALTSATNWVLQKHPMVYLAGAMAEACMYLRDTEGVQMWAGRYSAEVKQLQDTDDDALRSGSAMRVRAL